MFNFEHISRIVDFEQVNTGWNDYGLLNSKTLVYECTFDL